MIRPPRLASFCLELLYPAPLAQAVAGDLEEEFRERVALAGPRLASFWYWRQVATSARYAAQRRWANGDFTALAICAALGLAALCLVSEAGRFVLSQVPRKAAADLPLAFEIVRWSAAVLLPAAGVVLWRKEKGEERG
jgi:hypothetical protein